MQDQYSAAMDWVTRMNRRADHALRQTISHIEQMMLNIPDPETILSRCLEELAALLNAEYGYVFSTRPGNQPVPPWSLVACRETSGGIRSVAGISTSSFIPAPLLGPFRLGKPRQETQRPRTRIPCPPVTRIYTTICVFP